MQNKNRVVNHNNAIRVQAKSFEGKRDEEMSDRKKMMMWGQSPHHCNSYVPYMYLSLHSSSSWVNRWTCRQIAVVHDVPSQCHSVWTDVEPEALYHVTQAFEVSGSTGSANNAMPSVATEWKPWKWVVSPAGSISPLKVQVLRINRRILNVVIICCLFASCWSSSFLIVKLHISIMSAYAYGAYRANASVVDLVPKDMLFMVPEHWYRFPPINPLWHSLLGFVMILLGIVSIIGNGMVLYLMTTVRSLRTPTNMLICNLAFSDFMMMATNAPTMAREFTFLKVLPLESVDQWISVTTSSVCTKFYPPFLCSTIKSSSTPHSFLIFSCSHFPCFSRSYDSPIRNLLLLSLHAWFTIEITQHAHIYIYLFSNSELLLRNLGLGSTHVWAVRNGGINGR